MTFKGEKLMKSAGVTGMRGAFKTLLLLKFSQSKINSLTLLTSASYIDDKEMVGKKRNIFVEALNYFV